MEWTSIIDCAYDCTISVGTITGTGNITIQLKDFEGKNLNVISGVHMYITSDSDGLDTDTITSATAVSGIVNELLTDAVWLIISETDGSAVVTLDGITNESVYANIVLPNGKIVTSKIITFTS